MPSVSVWPSFEAVRQRYQRPNQQSKICDSINTLLLTRAWVFQERQLAPRLFMFIQQKWLWNANLLSTVSA